MSDNENMYEYDPEIEESEFEEAERKADEELDERHYILDKEDDEFDEEFVKMEVNLFDKHSR
jgi:hypothetical protein